MSRPTNILAGDTYTYTVSNADYPASAGWTLKVTINNPTVRLQVSATTNADGESYDVALASADTDGLTTGGLYLYHESVEKGSGATLQRHTIYAGTVNVTKDVTTGSTATDARSTARKMLDAVETTILANLGKGHETMQIAARAIGYRSWEEMLRVRNRLAMEVKAEDDAFLIAQGLEPNKPVRTRFGGIV